MNISPSSVLGIKTKSFLKFHTSTDYWLLLLFSFEASVLNERLVFGVLFGAWLVGEKVHSLCVVENNNNSLSFVWFGRLVESNSEKDCCW